MPSELQISYLVEAKHYIMNAPMNLH